MTLELCPRDPGCWIPVLPGPVPLYHDIPQVAGSVGSGEKKRQPTARRPL